MRVREGQKEMKVQVDPPKMEALGSGLFTLGLDRVFSKIFFFFLYFAGTSKPPKMEALGGALGCLPSAFPKSFWRGWIE